MLPTSGYLLHNLFDRILYHSINVDLEVNRLQVYSSSYKSTLEAISKLIIRDFYGYNNLIITKKYSDASICLHFISNSATFLRVKLRNLLFKS